VAELVTKPDHEARRRTASGRLLPVADRYHQSRADGLADLTTVAPVLPGGPLIKHSTVEFVMRGPVGVLCACELARAVLSLVDECLREATIEGREILREVSASIQGL
jgi:hypothetical protein